MTNYTTLEQSKKLVKLGLDPKTADMNWSIVDCETFICFENHSNYETVPCWSVGALIANLPVIRNHGATIQVTTSGEFFVRYNQEPKYYNGPMIYCETDCKKNLVSALVDMYCILHKLGEF